MKKLFSFFMILLMSVVFAFGQDESVELNSAYSDINVTKDNEMIQNLLVSNKKLVDKSVKKVLKNLDAYNPAVLYVVSNIYFEENKDEAAKIFYIAQLRARIDANICQDQTAAEAVSILNQQFGPLINSYGFGDIENLKKIVTKAIDHVRKNKVSYDRRWINLHGMKAFINDGKTYTAPKEEWDDIIRTTIEDYEKGFNEALKQFEEMQKDL